MDSSGFTWDDLIAFTHLKVLLVIFSRIIRANFLEIDFGQIIYLFEKYSYTTQNFRNDIF